MTGGGPNLLDAAAVLAIAGLPVGRFLTTADPVERLTLGAIADRVVEAIDRLQRQQAVHIANAIVKSQRR